MAFRSAMTTTTPALPADLTYTANGALSHAGTGSARLDYFSKALARDKGHATTNAEIERMAAAAWDESPEDLLRLLAHKRDCRGGAGERRVAQVTWRWLSVNHPLQVSANMANIVFYGRWKDLLDYFLGTPLEDEALDLMVKQLATDYATMTSAHEALESIADDAADEASQAARKAAQQQIGQLTLVAKWAPTEGCTFDKTKRAGAKYPASHLVAHKLWVATGHGRDVHSKIMKWYRSVLTQLRDSTGVVERLLCLGKWDDIEFSKVPSRALALYARKCFPAHAAERFAQWQKDVLAGKAKMNSSQVDPYEVVRRIIDREATASEMPTLEAFYKTQLEELAKKGDLGKSLVMADVSGSMTGTPMAVSVSMAIWMSALASSAFRNMFVTFDKTPAFVDLSDCTTLEARVRKTLAAPWGGSTNLQAAFQLILRRAQEHHVTPEDMPTRLFIVSDMQFNVACYPNVFTNYEVIKSRYRAAGYTIPEIVFWNVNGSTGDAPVTKDTNGVALVGGFSKDLIKLFLQNEPIKSPHEVMRLAIDAERYDRMVYVNDSGVTVPTLVRAIVSADAPAPTTGC